MTKLTTALFCVVLCLSACASPDTKPPLATAQTCNLTDIDIANAEYEAQLEDVWDSLRENVYVHTITPYTERDRLRAARYQAEMSQLDRDMTIAYSNARNSCTALIACERNGAGACSAPRGRMLISVSEFYAMQGRIDARAAAVASYEPFTPPPNEPYAGPQQPAAPAGQPTVRREQNCPTVADVLTVCAED